MKLLTRDTSSYRFMTLGGLLSRKQLPNLHTPVVPDILTETVYRDRSRAFGADEEQVRRFIMDLMSELGWAKVTKNHDVLATSQTGDLLLVECKKFKGDILYLEDHKGGRRGENAVQELQRNLEAQKIKWGILTDGHVFRLYHRGENDESLAEAYLEICLADIIRSTHRWPEEMALLVDFLSPKSQIRGINPRPTQGLNKDHLRKIVKLLREDKKYFKSVLKALATAALEDMGIRPMHTGIKSIRSAKTAKDIELIF